MFLNKIELKQVSECLADPSKIRIFAEFDVDISNLMPYLNAILEGAIYNPNGHTLTFKKEMRIITLYPNYMFAAKVDNEKDAEVLMNFIKSLINDVYTRREKIVPNYERRKQVNAIDIYKFLPGQNCGMCGEITCLAFAVKLAKEEINIIKCSELLSGRYKEKKQMLVQLLISTGYTVPEFLKNI